MNKKYQANHLSDESQGEQDVIAEIKKIQKHLVFLEKKIDTLVEHSTSRSFNREGRSFNKEGRSFSREARPFNREGRAFNKGSHFSKPYKSHSHSHRSDHHKQDRPFDKPWRGDHRSHSQNKKHKFRGGHFSRGRKNTAVIER